MSRSATTAQLFLDIEDNNFNELVINFSSNVTRPSSSRSPSLRRFKLVRFSTWHVCV